MQAMIPGEVGEIWLEVHADMPRESRPVFLAKAPSIREARENAREWDATFGSRGPDDHYDALLAMFMRLVVGWRNWPKEFSRDAVEESLTVSGMRSLLRSVLTGEIVTHEEKKS